MPLEEGNKRAALSAIADLHTRDNTNLSGGWLRGAELVSGYLEAHPGCRNRVLLLSDGHANDGITDPNELGKRAETLSGRGIHSSAVGIGSDYSSAQMEAIARNGGGRLHRASTPPEIIEVVLGELDDIAATVAENIAVEIRYPSGVQVDLLGDFPVAHTQQQVSCQLGSLIAAATRLAIFKIKAPTGFVNDPLAFTSVVRWSPPGSREMLGVEVPAAVLRFAQETANNAQPRQPTLSMEVARVWQGAVLRRAVRLNREGSYVEARQLLETELRYFERYCEGLPQTAPLVAEMRTALADIAQVWDEGRRRRPRSVVGKQHARSAITANNSERQNLLMTNPGSTLASGNARKFREATLFLPSHLYSGERVG